MINNAKNHIDLNRAIIRGEAGGKVLWQPRILCWYDDRMFNNIPLPEPYTGMNPRQLYEALGCSNRIYEYNAAVEVIEHPSIKRYSRELDEMRTQRFIETPQGTISAIFRRNTSNSGEYLDKWWAENEKDLEVLMYIEENQDWRFNQENYDKLYEEWGVNGLGSIYFPRTTVQSLYHDTMGIEGGIFALADMPDVVEEYFKIKQKNHDRFINMIRSSPFEWINFGDNIHCGTLPASLFEEYVLPDYLHRNELLHQKDKSYYTFAHWDGDTRSILKYAQETGLDGIEAITPLPQGDVTVQQIKEALGDKVGLIDGVAASLFNDIYPIEMLEAQVMELIHLFAGKLILGISDELPSTGNIDRVKYVTDLVEKYNATC